MAGEIIEIADDVTNDFMKRKRADGSEETVLDSEHVQRSRIRIDARIPFEVPAAQTRSKTR